MKLVCNLAATLVRSRGFHSSAFARRLGTEMCKELKTKVLRLLTPTSKGPTVPDETDGAEILSCTVKALKDSHVVAVPTDTIYGLACLAQNSKAIRKTYDIKGRNGQKPLAICVGEIQDIYKPTVLHKHITHMQRSHTYKRQRYHHHSNNTFYILSDRYCKVKVKRELLCDLLPGPVTLVFERSEELNTDLNPFTSLVGVRIPDHPFMRQLCQMCGEPLALTSANISSQSSTVEVQEFQELWPQLAVVVDGGPIGDQSRLGSTVVDLSIAGKYHIIRPGCALSSTVDVLKHKYGLSEHSGEECPLNSHHSKNKKKDAQPALTQGCLGEDESVNLPSPGKTGTQEDLNC